MDDSLHQKTRDRIDELCEKISVAYTLDAEIQEELRGHMEDKLLAYLHGQEPLTEDDALLLVREHFGDPAMVKSLLQDVHIVETHVSFARRLVAIIAVYLVYMSGASFIISIASGFISLNKFRGITHGLPIPHYEVIIFLSLFPATIIFSCTMLYWERKIRAGKRPWFQRWRGTTIISILGIFAIAKLLVPMPGIVFNRVLFSPQQLPLVFNKILIVLYFVCIVWQAIIWIWWCARPPRLKRTITYAALAWIVITIIPWQSMHIVQFDIYSYDPQTYRPDPTGQMILWQEHKDGISGIWALRIGTRNNLVSPIRFKDFLTSLYTSIFIIAIAKFFYVRFQRRREPPGGDFPTAES